MHPFSLKNDQSSQVTGGVVAGGCVTYEFKETGGVEITLSLKEAGGPVVVTQAIPEDGNDPRLELTM
ncbi:hypothetical protein [Pseudoalteromonas xiamenensis]|uniref:Uncharacterized protein n=1 Tax=Pseudoalteromonas xiamenensis TaxID=882626 RepID=A0A975HJT4_9GAMM|nr:hypothetical protein [Pseudoalteromonas xiamenensis]QTH70331.1 hypothetical protein J5O05_09900 [Pseudoalteromonas xiamenensis]WMN58598.1 hypothetical protein NI389_10040 [Pseudoalteromonas xiamenensis]